MNDLRVSLHQPHIANSKGHKVMKGLNKMFEKNGFKKWSNPQKYVNSHLNCSQHYDPPPPYQ